MHPLKNIKIHIFKIHKQQHTSKTKENKTVNKLICPSPSIKFRCE